MKHYPHDAEVLLPVIGIDDEYDGGFVDPLHSHPRDQLLYASTGVMAVTTAHAHYVIPPQRAIWIPRDMPHEVSCRGHVSLRTLYFADLASGETCRVIEVPDLLKALIVEAAGLGTQYEETPRVAHLIALLRIELAERPHAPFSAPMPRDYRLLRVARAIVADPANQDSIDTLASLAGMGRRTFTRAFRNETGMSLAVWRQQVRLMHALSLLSSGQPITTVAFDVGYDSSSAFTALFHRSFGFPPSQYQARG